MSCVDGSLDVRYYQVTKHGRSLVSEDCVTQKGLAYKDDEVRRFIRQQHERHPTWAPTIRVVREIREDLVI